MRKKTPLEKTFKKKFLAGLLEEFGSACRITPNDPRLTQGIPDVTINCVFDDGTLYWKDLEFKRESKSPHQPNQDYRTAKNGLFVCPENAEEVLHEIRQQVSKTRRRARLPKPE